MYGLASSTRSVSVRWPGSICQTEVAIAGLPAIITRGCGRADCMTREARVSVYSPHGLQSEDEYVLWGLLGVCLSRKQPEPTLLATPYWIIKRLGMSLGGCQYDQLRASLERLAAVAYQNTAFYNPVTQQHERITLHFFSSFLPTRGRGGPVDAERAWRIEWSPMFFQMCQATGGSLLFDLDVYRQLSPGARRLFLKLKDRFWRSKRVFLNVDDLTIHGLGFSADRPLKKRKFDLTACIRELLEQGIIELGRGQTGPQDLFLKRGKGLYVVQFFEGPYFRQPLAERTAGRLQKLTDDPLYQPLQSIGVDEAGIRRLFKQHSRGLIQRWIHSTDVAMHEKPRGFPGFRSSPAAFLMDGVQNERMPPDWIYAHDKERKRRQWEEEKTTLAADEQRLRDQFASERNAALQAFLKSEYPTEEFPCSISLPSAHFPMSPCSSCSPDPSGSSIPRRSNMSSTDWRLRSPSASPPPSFSSSRVLRPPRRARRRDGGSCCSG